MQSDFCLSASGKKIRRVIFNFFSQEKISDDKKTSLREKRATVTSSTTYTDIPVPTLFSSAMRLRLGRRRGFRRDDVSKVNREMSKHNIQGFQ